MRTKDCANCGKEFTCVKNRLCCSGACRQRVDFDRRRGWSTQTRTCGACGISFVTRDPKKRYCAHACYAKHANKRTKVQGKYGLTVEAYDRMMREANGICAICRERPTDRLVLDHCHSSTIARGVLCTQCNSGLGMFGDDIARLYAAIEYLKRFQEKVA
jgi:hypothetical protein